MALKPANKPCLTTTSYLSVGSVSILPGLSPGLWCPDAAQRGSAQGVFRARTSTRFMILSTAPGAGRMLTSTCARCSGRDSTVRRPMLAKNAGCKCTLPRPLLLLPRCYHHHINCYDECSDSYQHKSHSDDDYGTSSEPQARVHREVVDVDVKERKPKRKVT